MLKNAISTVDLSNRSGGIDGRPTLLYIASKVGESFCSAASATALIRRSGRPAVRAHADLSRLPVARREANWRLVTGSFTGRWPHRSSLEPLLVHRLACISQRSRLCPGLSRLAGCDRCGRTLQSCPVTSPYVHRRLPDLASHPCAGTGVFDGGAGADGWK